jgi:cysteine desulfurase family protein (TIGR01976 family)
MHQTDDGQIELGGHELSRSIEEIRADFPGLLEGAVMLDGAAGTLVPGAVVEAVDDVLRFSMANVHGAFAASARSTETVREARRAIADLVGGVPDGVVLGPNMTTLTFQFADVLSAGWQPGDEVIVTSLDHDANIRPWVLAAQREGATVRWAEFDPSTGELPVERFDELLSESTRLVAVTAASNAIGTKPDVRAISDRAHAAGALIYVDGVHATPHGSIDVAQLGADFYACSTYKLFGPHVGAVISNPEQLELLRPPKLVPSPDAVPDRFERGTPAFELLAGVTAAIDWIAGLSDVPGGRREHLVGALAAVERYLGTQLVRALEGLGRIPRVRVLGAPGRRASTISFVVEGFHPSEIAVALAGRGIAVWDGDNYAHELMSRYGLKDSGGAIRASIVLYNSRDDVDRLLTALAEIAEGAAPSPSGRHAGA